MSTLLIFSANKVSVSVLSNEVYFLAHTVLSLHKRHPQYPISVEAHNLLNIVIYITEICFQHQFRGLWFFISENIRINPNETFDFSSLCFFVESLDILLFKNMQGSINKHLRENKLAPS